MNDSPEVLPSDPVIQKHTTWAARHGLYTPSLHTPHGFPPAVVHLSDLPDTDLSDQFSAWTSEAHRLLEMEAAAVGRKGELVLAVKRARANAATEVRSQSGQKLSAAAVDDVVSLDDQVQRCEDALSDLEVVLAFITRQKQAADLHLTLLSREITQRVSLRGARLL